MATILAQATGNWSNAATWAGGVLPGAGGATDDADSNGYTVTIDQDINLNGGALIGTSADAGGFTVPNTTSGTRAITADVTAIARTVLTIMHPNGTTLNLTGNVLGGSTAGYGITYSGVVGTTNIAGNVTGRAGTGFNATAASVNITGTVTGGTVSNVYGVDLPTGTHTIIGNVYCGSANAANGVRTGNNTDLTITGNVYGGAGNGQNAIQCRGKTLVVNGDVYQATAGDGSGITFHTNAITATINGNVYGNGSASDFGAGIWCQVSGTITINGDVVGHATAGYGVINNGAGIIICERLVAGAAYPAAWNKATPGSIQSKKLICASNGMMPVRGHFKLLPDAAVDYIEVIRSDTGAALKLNWDHPAVGDVRLGTSYDLAAKTGTMSGGAVSISPALGGGIG